MAFCVSEVSTVRKEEEGEEEKKIFSFVTEIKPNKKKNRGTGL